MTSLYHKNKLELEKILLFLLYKKINFNIYLKQKK